MIPPRPFLRSRAITIVDVNRGRNYEFAIQNTDALGLLAAGMDVVPCLGHLTLDEKSGSGGEGQGDEWKSEPQVPTESFMVGVRERLRSA